MDAKSIGENVKFYRKFRGLTQATLAKRTHMTQQNVGRIEKGKIMPPIDTLEALASALDVALPDLYCDEKYYDLNIDFTPYYKARMEHESSQVKEVMKRALIECNDKMTVILRLSKSEMESYKILDAGKKDPVKFWLALEEYGVKFALDTPADYVWCLDKLEEFNGDKKQVSKAWCEKIIKTWGLACTTGLPHNINNPWLCRKDYLQYLSLIGLPSISLS